MTIGRFYYFSLSIIVSSFLCISHYRPWPSEGYAPHKNTGNVYQRQKRDEGEILRQEQKKQRRERKKRERDGARREQLVEEPERIADFSRKSKRRGQSEPGSRPADYATAGREQRRSGDGEQQLRDDGSKAPSHGTKRDESAHTSQRNGGFKHNGSASDSQYHSPDNKRTDSVPNAQQPNGGPRRSGNITTGYVPYAYIYGDGPVRANGGQHFRSPTDSGGSPEGRVISTDRGTGFPRNEIQDIGLGLGLSQGGGLRTSSEQAMTDGDQPASTLRERRVKASPEKFNTGSFQTLPLRKAQGSSRVFGDAGSGSADAKTSSSMSLQLAGVKASTDTFNTGTFEAPSLRQTVLSKPLPSAKRLRGEDGTPRAVQSPGSKLIADLNALGIKTPALLESQLTGGLSGLGFATPTAYTIPLSAIPPTPRTTKPQTFNLLNALCKHNDLMLLLTSYLTIPALTSLYAIHKPFHHVFNCHHTAFIKSIMRTWAPHADKIFPWRCYQKLCVKDPRQRQKLRLEGKEKEVRYDHEDLRDVPSLRWLQMVVWREGICRDMVMMLAVKGHRCPGNTSMTLKRLWFLLDVPVNAARIAVIRTKTYFTNITLRVLTSFFLKVDMLFTDPIGRVFPANHPDSLRFPPEYARQGFTGVQLREILLAERSLVPLWRVLRGWSPDPEEPKVHMDRLDVLKLWVRHHYKRPADELESVRDMEIMGLPLWANGTAGLERIGVPFFVPDEDDTSGKPAFLLIKPETKRKPDPLLRPDELVMREGIRRELKLHKLWVRMMTWGHYDLRGRRIPRLNEEQILQLGRGQPLFLKAKVVQSPSTEHKAKESEGKGGGKVTEAAQDNTKDQAGKKTGDNEDDRAEGDAAPEEEVAERGNGQSEEEAAEKVEDQMEEEDSEDDVDMDS